MALLTVRLYGDPVLRQVATPVRAITAEIKQVITDMTETMWHQVGIGLAAPQVGLPHRILVMDDGTGGAQTLINPEIESRSGTIREEEGCLSLPGIFGVVERSKTITVKATDADGKSVSFEATGLKARIVQHELDHLDGVLFIDRIHPDLKREARRRLREQALSGVPPQPVSAL